MARYFFDIRDRDGFFADEAGLDLPDMDAAVAEARRALGEMVKDALRDGHEETIEILIRDGSDGPILLSISMASRDLKQAAEGGP